MHYGQRVAKKGKHQSEVGCTVQVGGYGSVEVMYLSFALQGLEQVLITGGTPPIGNGWTADSVYRAWL
ncbi:proline iminopeptidase [Cucumis melo var. makuwa]|uniref:Proline iminopeptidase n=1 Tax=Cucumis melo var. makuwa TaxID=1194695 RepID=A0A5A7U5R8_CUCMM|nr:proline iminopeptidase [Cucumis melo var. makuwa]